MKERQLDSIRERKLKAIEEQQRMLKSEYEAADAKDNIRIQDLRDIIRHRLSWADILRSC